MDIELFFAGLGVAAVGILATVGLFSVIAMLMFGYEKTKEPHD